jgi:hypothetical protein
MWLRSQRHAPASLYHGANWIGGWVDLRGGLDTGLEEKYFASARDGTLVVQSRVSNYTYWASPLSVMVIGLYEQ